MAEVRAFKGIRYDESVVGDLSLAMSPPYDVIDAAYQDKLYAQSEYGVVRIDFGKAKVGDNDSVNKYSRAKDIYSEWLATGVLKQDDEPSIYYVEEDYAGEFGGVGTRSGFLAAVRVEDAESGVYRPHEKTLAGPKMDRLLLTRACKANLSPVFSLYDDPESVVDSALSKWKASAGEPVARVKRQDGFEIRMWRICDAGVVETINVAMQPKSFFIADGHHRYETALNYRNEMRRAYPSFTGTEDWNYTLMYLVNMHSPGLTVLPTHRAVHGLADFSCERFLSALSDKFVVDSIEGGVAELLAAMKNERGKLQAIGVVLKGVGGNLIAKPKPGFDPDAEFPAKSAPLRTLDVTLLHSLVIERILGISEKAQEDQTNLAYVKDANDLVAMVNEGRANVGFLMNPTPVSSVKNAAEAGERMPQKSTFFYPKLVTGLVMNPLG